MLESSTRATWALPVVLAMDVGGTKTAVAIVNTRGEIKGRWRWPTDAAPETSVDRLAKIVSDLAGQPGGAPSAIGIAVPAVLDDTREQVIWAPNLPGWKDACLTDLLTHKTGLPVALDLDGHLAAVGEHWLGALRGIDDCVCVVVGTGIGAGVFVQGRLVRGRQNLSGCLGWMVVGDTEAAPGRASAVGWLESHAGGNALQERAAALGHGQSGEPVEQLVFASMEGDQEATAVLLRAGELIGRAVANVVNLLSPHAVALGGTVVRGAPVLLAEVKKTVEMYVQPYLRKDLAIVEVETGADAPLLGAARMAMDSSGTGSSDNQGLAPAAACK
jgi:glucokinase